MEEIENLFQKKDLEQLFEKIPKLVDFQKFFEKVNYLHNF